MANQFRLVNYQLFIDKSLRYANNAVQYLSGGTLRYLRGDLSAKIQFVSRVNLVETAKFVYSIITHAVRDAYTTLISNTTMFI